MASLTDQLLGSSSTNAVPAQQQATPLTDELLTLEPSKPAAKSFDIEKETANNRGAFVQGLNDIVNAVGSGIGYLDEKFAPGGKERNEKFKGVIKKENETFEASNPPSEGILPTVGEVARMSGQFVGTIPLMPMKAFQTVKGMMGALPTVSITGEKVAAPLLNRLGSDVVIGGASGTGFGALTSTSNDKSLTENLITGGATGAATAPVLTVAGQIASKIIPAIKSGFSNYKIGQIAREHNFDPASVKNTVQVLENAGFTPAQVKAELARLGPNATLSDLSPSLMDEASGLASIGGKPTEILKGRYEARSKTANSSAHNLMETQLGPKPNIEAEKEAVVKLARKETGADYKIAKTSGKDLDVSSVINDIDAQLQTAVGAKKSALTEIKNYYYKLNGTLKNDVASLHEVRQAIDDLLEKKGTPQTSFGKNAIDAISDVRKAIDAKLKTIPEMAAADAKYAEKMTIKNDLDFGYNALKNRGMNKEEFANYFDSASPERQAAIATGMRGSLGDLMEAATRGELSEAQRLFGKSSLNRANFEKVFGNRGTQVLDALEKEATLRATESGVRFGAQTASRQSIQRKYGERDDGGGKFKDIIQGAVLDTISGTPGGATAIMTAKRAGSSAKMSLSDNSRQRMIEGTSDLISRQGAERDTAVEMFNRVKAIQDKLKPRFKISIPTSKTIPLVSAPIGELGYSQVKSLEND